MLLGGAGWAGGSEARRAGFSLATSEIVLDFCRIGAQHPA